MSYEVRFVVESVRIEQFYFVTLVFPIECEPVSARFAFWIDVEDHPPLMKVSGFIADGLFDEAQGNVGRVSSNVIQTQEVWRRGYGVAWRVAKETELVGAELIS
jgi:hypothetical protein